MKRLFFLSTLYVLLGTLSFAQAKADPGKNNLVKNGDFISLLDNWLYIGQGTNPYHPQDPGQADFTVEKGALKIAVKNQGTSAYSIMVYQSVLFEKGAVYVVSFDAMSDAPMPIVSNVTQDGTYQNFSGDVTLKITARMTRYSYEFTMPVAGAALFQLCLGNLGTRKLSIDNISINKKTTVTTP